jgi:hypothetical protein
MRIIVEVEDLVRRTGDGQPQVRYSVVGRSGGRVMLCAICTVHEEMRSASFSSRFVSGLALKSL